MDLSIYGLPSILSILRLVFCTFGYIIKGSHILAATEHYLFVICFEANMYWCTDGGYILISTRYTDKSEVFSFGMILGVLLTGRDPSDPFFREPASGGSLGQWLRHLQQAGEAREALDTSILGEEGEEDEMLMAVRIAVVCLSDFPADRPSSDELVHMLTQLHSF